MYIFNRLPLIEMVEPLFTTSPEEKGLGMLKWLPDDTVSLYYTSVIQLAYNNNEYPTTILQIYGVVTRKCTYM